MRSTGKGSSSTRSSRRHGTASLSNRPYYQSTVRASNRHPGAASYSELCFEADMYAADVLRNDSRQPVPHCVLQPAALAIVQHLMRRGLTHVKNRLALEMMRPDL